MRLEALHQALEMLKNILNVNEMTVAHLLGLGRGEQTRKRMANAKIPLTLSDAIEDFARNYGKNQYPRY
jgi:hypothetical protein